MPKIQFSKEGKTIAVNSGANVRQVAKQNDVQIYKGLYKYLNCHGMALCGTCVVEIEEGADKLSPITRGEEKLLAKQGLEPGKYRLACQCYIHSDVKVKTLG